MCVPLERVCLSHSSECAYPTRASSGSLLGRMKGLCTSEQGGFARAIRMEACEPLASRHASLSHRGMRASRIEACEPLAWRHASHSHRGMRASRIEACEPLAWRHASHSHRGMRAIRRGAFLQGSLFVETKLKIIAYILGLIFTIQIYIGTLIFARRAYGVIL